MLLLVLVCVLMSEHILQAEMAGSAETAAILDALNSQRADARERQAAMERQIREEARRLRGGIAGDGHVTHLTHCPQHETIIQFWRHITAVNEFDLRGHSSGLLLERALHCFACTSIQIALILYCCPLSSPAALCQSLLPISHSCSFCGEAVAHVQKW